MAEPSRLQHFDASYARIDSSGGHNFSYNVGNVQVIGSGNIVTINSGRKEAPRVPAPRCPPASPNFVGRVLEQERMWKFFFGDGVRFDQRRAFLLIGMGGCGKTQLARKFMARVYRKFKDAPHLVFYLDATTTETLRGSLASIAKANGVGDSFEAALAWMSALDKECFLYFDNADDDAINLRDYFPDSEHVRILITTRLRESQQHYGTGRGSAIHLDPLSEGEAIELLELTADIDPDIPRDKSTIPLVQELHYLPLAIVQAGAAIFRSQSTVDDYLQQFLQLRTSLMDGKQDQVQSKAMDDYPMHVYTTWRLSYDRLPESTATLLRLCAHLHHTGITEDLFELASEGLAHPHVHDPSIPFANEELSVRSFLESFTVNGTWDKTQFRWTIQEACAVSLLSYDSVNHVYSIHPLIHDCLQSIAPHPSQAGYVLATTIMSSWEDQARLASLVPHVQQVLRNSDDGEGGPLHPILVRNMGQSFWHAGMYSAAQNVYEDALRQLAPHVSPDHDVVLILQNELAITMAFNGCYADAEEIQRALLEKSKAILGPEHPETIIALGNLASTLKSLGRHTEAEGMAREVLDNRQVNLGRNHVHTIWALANLAEILHALGRYSEAEELDREALTRRQAILGPGHTDTLRAMASLAATLRSLGRYTEAEEIEREVLEKRQAILGPDHPDTIRAVANLADTLYFQGRYKEAEVMAREVLEKRRASTGPSHVDTIKALAALANVLHSLGQYTEAEGMKREVLENRKAILGPDDALTIRALETLAETLAFLGRYTEAERMQRQVLEHRRVTLGPDHNATTTALASLACTLSCLGHHTEAEVMIREALEKKQTALGANHPETITMLSNLATIIASLGRFAEAEVIQREVLEKRQAVLGPDHIETVKAMGNLGLTLQSLGHYPEAERIGREVLDRSQSILGPGHIHTIQASANLAETLRFLGRYSEAEAMETEVLEQRGIILGVDHPDTHKASINLALTFLWQSRHEEALPMFSQGVEGLNRTLGPHHSTSIWAQRGLEGWIGYLNREREAESTSQADSADQSEIDPPTELDALSDLRIDSSTPSPLASTVPLEPSADPASLVEASDPVAFSSSTPTFSSEAAISLSSPSSPRSATPPTAIGNLRPRSLLPAGHIRLGLAPRHPTRVPLLAALTTAQGSQLLQRDSTQGHSTDSLLDID